VIRAAGLGARVDKSGLAAEGRLLAPIDHPDAAHLFVTGTSLTHLGSASTRDAVHKSDQQAPEEWLTDSRKMFCLGLKGGKPTQGQIGVQPDWFYKGNGNIIIARGGPIPSPAFARDAGEEPEIAGIYYIGCDGTPFRLGFALASSLTMLPSGSTTCILPIPSCGSVH
jgi:hypothetical protein